jgi:hypothetical protein
MSSVDCLLVSMEAPPLILPVVACGEVCGPRHPFGFVRSAWYLLNWILFQIYGSWTNEMEHAVA